MTAPTRHSRAPSNRHSRESGNLLGHSLEKKIRTFAGMTGANQEGTKNVRPQ
jgi:hypothetical protein